MSLSSTLSGVAKTVLKQFGVLCSFEQETSTGFDPGSGINSVTTATFTGYGVKGIYSKSETNGTTIKSSDIKLILEDTATVPKIGDKCTIGSLSYRVMNVTPIDPADESIIYEVQLRV